MQIAYCHYLCRTDTALNHVRQFVRGAHELGHQVEISAMNLRGNGDISPSESSFAGRIRRVTKRHLSSYLHEPKEVAWNLPYIRKELKILRVQQPDVLLVL